jgi:hypothetical protein
VHEAREGMVPSIVLIKLFFNQMHEIDRDQLIRGGLRALIGISSELLVLCEGEVDVVLNEHFLEHSALKGQISEDERFLASLQLLPI